MERPEQFLNEAMLKIAYAAECRGEMEKKSFLRRIVRGATRNLGKGLHSRFGVDLGNYANDSWKLGKGMNAQQGAESALDALKSYNGGRMTGAQFDAANYLKQNHADLFQQLQGQRGLRDYIPGMRNEFGLATERVAGPVNGRMDRIPNAFGADVPVPRSEAAPRRLLGIENARNVNLDNAWKRIYGGMGDDARNVVDRNWVNTSAEGFSRRGQKVNNLRDLRGEAGWNANATVKDLENLGSGAQKQLENGMQHSQFRTQQFGKSIDDASAKFDDAAEKLRKNPHDPAAREQFEAARKELSGHTDAINAYKADAARATELQTALDSGYYQGKPITQAVRAKLEQNLRTLRSNNIMPGQVADLSGVENSLNKLRQRSNSFGNELDAFHTQHAKLNTDLGKLNKSIAAEERGINDMLAGQHRQLLAESDALGELRPLFTSGSVDTAQLLETLNHLPANAKVGDKSVTELLRMMKTNGPQSAVDFIKANRGSLFVDRDFKTWLNSEAARNMRAAHGSELKRLTGERDAIQKQLNDLKFSGEPVAPAAPAAPAPTPAAPAPSAAPTPAAPAPTSAPTPGTPAKPAMPGGADAPVPYPNQIPSWMRTAGITGAAGLGGAGLGATISGGPSAQEKELMAQLIAAQAQNSMRQPGGLNSVFGMFGS